MNMPEIDIYTTRYCPYCIAAKRLLTHKGVTFTEIDVSGDQIAGSKMVVRTAA
jgi:glutaredoxin 3